MVDARFLLAHGHFIPAPDETIDAPGIDVDDREHQIARQEKTRQAPGPVQTEPRGPAGMARYQNSNVSSRKLSGPQSRRTPETPWGGARWRKGRGPCPDRSKPDTDQIEKGQKKAKPAAAYAIAIVGRAG
jgi:hypothetical protein